MAQRSIDILTHVEVPPVMNSAHVAFIDPAGAGQGSFALRMGILTAMLVCRQYQRGGGDDMDVLVDFRLRRCFGLSLAP